MNFDLPRKQVPTIIKGLGWFSIGLGIAELFAPRQISRGAGMREQNSLLRGYGLREIVTGIGILTAANPRPWLWGRVAGDVLDIATVGATADVSKSHRLGSSFAALLGVGLLDFYCAIKSVPQGPLPRSPGQYDYSKRSGFPRSIEQMRGAAARGRPAPSLQELGSVR